MRFKNKVVIVTGASRGIGQAVCVAFAREGARIVGVARSDLAETASEVKKAGGEFVAANADLSEGTQKEAADLISHILQKAGRVDALVNNAGIIRRAPAVDFSERDW
ncbi:MAG TPA: SDR family NAD(P)-dependent oxidoreductase, partial [Verrucomicrobiae bacterium]|nr:SDR family NAD(P)-dependent oxidoreductase [Verrucomicrobiae bacterium]